jgi:tetratricopeptide (TPR) repeat protein
MSALDNVQNLDKLKPAYATKRHGNQVANKAPAQLQITAEQILREAQERRDDQPFAEVEQKITDQEELDSYRLTKRKEFEDQLRRQRQNMGVWMNYAKWEEKQREFERARSVFERAMDTDYRTPTLWRQYAEMEMRNGFANHARNVWDRAVQLLPRIDQLWCRSSQPIKCWRIWAHVVSLLLLLLLPVCCCVWVGVQTSTRTWKRPWAIWRVHALCLRVG